MAEASEILCVLLDTRCPLLHFPPSLQDYIFTLRPRKQCILVLTKADLVPASVADAWKRYLEASFGYSVVLVQSYKEEDRRARTQGEGYPPPETVRLSKPDVTDILDRVSSEISSRCTFDSQARPHRCSQAGPSRSDIPSGGYEARE